MKPTTFYRSVLLFLVVLWPISAALCAQSWEDRLKIHGFGGWAYGETDGNRYFLATDDGEVENVQFALNLRAMISEDLTVVAQLNYEGTEETLGEEEVQLDYLFAEWALSNAFKIRAGRVKHPVGNYGEVVNVGTIRPFYMLPRSVYGPQGVTARAYHGIGFVGGFYGDRWGLGYHLYGGEIESIDARPGAFTRSNANVLEPWLIREFGVRNVIGIKLDLKPPIPGLTWGVFGHQGEQDPDQAIRRGEVGYDLLGTHLEYLSERWEFRAEATQFDWEGRGDTESYYVEVAFRPTRRWQVAARYDDFALIVNRTPRNPIRIFFRDSEDLGLALNYWWTPDLVLRLNYHQVEGNRFAFPNDPAVIEEILAGQRPLDQDTEVLIFGIQFSF